MVIGFDGSRAFYPGRTGTENYSYSVLYHLSKIDSKNQYLVYLRPGCQVEPKDWPDNFKFKLINFSKVWTQSGLAFQTFTDKLDILFVSAHTYPIIRKPGIKIVMTVHDLGAEYLGGLHNLKQRLYLKAVTKFQLKSATHLIAVSNTTKQDLINQAEVNPKKITIIYEGYNKSLYKPLKNDQIINTLKSFGIEKENYYLFVGTIQPRKNLERLITAFANVNKQVLGYDNKELYTSPSAQSDNLILVLVGKKGWLSDQIYALPAKLGIEDKVRFLGYVPDNDLPGLYSGAKALLFPSLYEGFGLPVLEAFACKCPVLTSNISSLPEVAGDAAVLVDPESIEDITLGIEKVSNKAVTKELVKKGFKRKAQFSWEKCARETLEVLEKVGKNS